MYCLLFNKYVDDAECDRCDQRAGYEKDAWRWTCVPEIRIQHHPIRSKALWWLRVREIDDLRFRLYVAAYWLIKKINPDTKISLWADKEGWHLSRFPTREIVEWFTLRGDGGR